MLLRVYLRARCPPLLSVSVGLLVGRQLDDEHAGLSVLKALLVVGRLWRALGVQHEDLGHKENTSTRSPGLATIVQVLIIQYCSVVISSNNNKAPQVIFAY